MMLVCRITHLRCVCKLCSICYSVQNERRLLFFSEFENLRAIHPMHSIFQHVREQWTSFPERIASPIASFHHNELTCLRACMIARTLFRLWPQSCLSSRSSQQKHIATQPSIPRYRSRLRYYLSCITKRICARQRTDRRRRNDPELTMHKLYPRRHDI